MSHANHQTIAEKQHEIISHGLTVPQLVELLKHAKGLVHPAGLEHALEVTKTGVATEKDWHKFFAAVNSLADVPVVTLNEVDEAEKHKKHHDAGHDNSQTVVAAGAGTVIAAIALALQIAETLWNFFRGFDDKEGRSRWTQELVRDARANDPTWNYVVVCTSHSINFNGREETDWSRRTYRYRLRIGGINYTLYAFRSGVFTLHGDGGFLNWAFAGRVVSADPDSRRPRNVVFHA